VVVLEITTPTRAPLSHFYALWFDRVVPALGKVLPGGSAYTYLPASVKRFPSAEELADLMRSLGFGEVAFRLFGGSIVALHTGVAGTSRRLDGGSQGAEAPASPAPERG